MESLNEMKSVTQHSSVITLLDGREIVCYPKTPPDPQIDNKLKLDTTGQYLTIGSKKQVMRQTLHNDELAQKFFTNHAFFFLKHHEKILGDSRMFLAPVTINNHLAYFGTSGFLHPTLGIYLQWWLTCEFAAIEGKNEDDCWLVYLIAGSPLSGANSCGIVNPSGTCKTTSLGNVFPKVWRSFVKINNRYDKAKEFYEAYTLEEVVELLKQ